MTVLLLALFLYTGGRPDPSVAIGSTAFGARHDASVFAGQLAAATEAPALPPWLRESLQWQLAYYEEVRDLLEYQDIVALRRDLLARAPAILRKAQEHFSAKADDRALMQDVAAFLDKMLDEVELTAVPLWVRQVIDDIARSFRLLYRMDAVFSASAPEELALLHVVSDGTFLLAAAAGPGHPLAFALEMEAMSASQHLHGQVRSWVASRCRQLSEEARARGDFTLALLASVPPSDVKTVTTGALEDYLAEYGE